jgi:hypothetical protein
MMKLSNFEIGDNYAISMDSAWLDLHNDYDFKTYQYDATTSSAVLLWVRSKLGPSETSLAQNIAVRFVNVKLLKIELLAGAAISADAETLSFLGFLHPDDLEVMDGCLTQEESDSTYHMIFRFENGLSIKCFSETVTCDLET